MVSDGWKVRHDVLYDAREQFARDNYPLEHRPEGRLEWMRTFAVLALDYLTEDEVRVLSDLASVCTDVHSA